MAAQTIATTCRQSNNFSPLIGTATAFDTRGIYGTMFLAVEPSVRLGVPNVPGGAIVEITRLSPVFRPLLAGALALRTPSLLNAVTGPPPFFGGPPLFGFVDNIPFRDQAPVTNTVPGTAEIQTVIESSEWVTQAGNPVAYAPHLRKNPTASALIRAGELEDRATFFRNDLAFAANPSIPKNPHTFLTGVLSPVTFGIAREGQQQIATFFASELVPGMTPLVIDPDTLGLFPVAVYEVPVVLPLPEGLNFIP